MSPTDELTKRPDCGEDCPHFYPGNNFMSDGCPAMNGGKCPYDDK